MYIYIFIYIYIYRKYQEWTQMARTRSLQEAETADEYLTRKAAPTSPDLQPVCRWVLDMFTLSRCYYSHNAPYYSHKAPYYSHKAPYNSHKAPYYSHKALASAQNYH